MGNIKKILIAVLLTIVYIALLPFDMIWSDGVGLLVDILVIIIMIVFCSLMIAFYFLDLANDCEAELFSESARLLSKPSSADVS